MSFVDILQIESIIFIKLLQDRNFLKIRPSKLVDLKKGTYRVY